ncbi:hypothetical protein [Aquipuribacter nitratireducens]|uniref:DUF91 domain-containing protein n=1 Tax=Aquipuribacter nitratireducens TaxID=650104 RepID=A0ABW0GTE3_9MICO
MARRILVTGGSGPVQFVERPADNEHELQTVLLTNPALMPAEDLGLDDELLVVGRETTLASGSVDLLCLSRSGELVVIEFKTGPQNPDFRHALAQVIDYGSDLWKLGSWTEFDEGVVHRYLTSRHVDPGVKTAQDLRAAAVGTWGLDDTGWQTLATRLDQVLITGDFHFVVAAQRFTEQMKDSVRYLNETTRYGKYFLVEVIRLDGLEQRAYAAQVVERPPARTSASGTASKATQTDFLAAIADPTYREAVSELFATVSALGLILAWYSKGASIRLRSPDRTEPISIGWVFLEGGQWYGARHITLGVDPGTLKSHPSLAPAVTEFCQRVSRVQGGKPAAGVLSATVFEPDAFTPAQPQLLALLSDLQKAAAAIPVSGTGSP